MSGWTAGSVPLPPELLIYIFDLATYSPAREIDGLVELKSFEGDYSADADSLCDAPLKTKWALALTCSLFRNLTSRFFYEDIRVRHGSDGLADALDNDPALGLSVKRISISLVGFKGAGHWCASFPTSTRRILQRCPNVVILTRPQSLPFDTADFEDGEFGPLPSDDIDLDDMQFPHLRRVDWFNSPIDMLPSTLPTPKFIWKSSSLQTLTIGPDYCPLQMDVSPLVDLPNLHTIRVRSLHTPGNVDEGAIDSESIRLPALRKLVFYLPDGIYTLFFEQFLRASGPRIETIELASHARFLQYDFISVLLLNCSNATTLNFPVFTTKPTRKNTRRQAVQIIYQITHVGLSAFGFQEEAEDAEEEDSQRTLLARHFLALFGERTRFSKLEQLTLYGPEWERAITDPRCRAALRLMKSKNMEIVCEHASVAAALKSVSEGLDFLVD